MLRTFLNSAAVIAATATLAGPLAAQTAPAAPGAPGAQPPVVTTTPAPAAPATTAQQGAAAAPATTPAPAATPAPAGSVPAALADLGITDATASEGRKGTKVSGTLPGGGAFRAMLDGQGTLRMIGTEDDAALPPEMVAQLVPQPVRDAALFGEFAVVRGVALKGAPPAAGAAATAADTARGGVMVFGADAQGQALRAGFAPDGTLQTLGRGGSDGKGGWGKAGDDDDDRRGKHKDGQRKGGKHGDGQHGDDRGPGRDGRGDGAGRGPGQDRGEGDDRGPRAGRDDQAGRMGGMAADMAPLDDAAVARVVTDAGYTRPGAITRNGPQTLVEAVNANDEPVTLTINPRGVVVREQAR